MFIEGSPKSSLRTLPLLSQVHAGFSSYISTTLLPVLLLFPSKYMKHMSLNETTCHSIAPMSRLPRDLYAFIHSAFIAQNMFDPMSVFVDITNAMCHSQFTSSLTCTCLLHRSPSVSPLFSFFVYRVTF